MRWFAASGQPARSRSRRVRRRSRTAGASQSARRSHHRASGEVPRLRQRHPPGRSRLPARDHRRPLLRGRIRCTRGRDRARCCSCCCRCMGGQIAAMRRRRAATRRKPPGLRHSESRVEQAGFAPVAQRQRRTGEDEGGGECGARNPGGQHLCIEGHANEEAGTLPSRPTSGGFRAIAVRRPPPLSARGSRTALAGSGD